MFHSETPLDVNAMSQSQVLSLVASLNREKDGIKIESKYNLLQKIYKALNFTLSNDIILSVLVNTKFQLVLAPAGGCKTTTSQVKLIFTKILWNYWYKRPLVPNECLCLVYNHENRQQMEQVHDSLLAKLQIAGVVSSNPLSKSFVNPGITTHTLHSFSNSWIQEYADDIGWSNYSVLKDSQTLMHSATMAVLESNPNSTAVYPDVEALVSLYEVMHSMLISVESLASSQQLDDLVNKTKVPVLLIPSCFKYYEKLKKFYKKYDFVDMLTKMSWLLDQPQIQGRMVDLYSCFVVDEVQDFTPLMLDILRKLISPDKRMIAIGDDDQSLYAFRGASSSNMLELKRIFPNLDVYQMFYNRRCGSNILASARKVIELNKDRFAKTLTASKGGGEVHRETYKSVTNMTKKLLTNIHPDEGRVVICSRERAHGMPITFELYKNGIDFHTLNSSSFVSHPKLTSFVQVLNLLLKPVRDNWLNFYKICSLSKSEWQKFIEYDSDLGIVRGFPEINNLFDLDFSKFETRSNFMVRFGILKAVAKSARSMQCAGWFKAVYDIFEMDYWNTVELYGNIEKDSGLSEEWIKYLFCINDILPNALDRFNQICSKFKRNQKDGFGVTVATMHALKGLEFDEVHIMNLADSVFPNFAKIQLSYADEESVTRDMESENRLMYVAMTRAISNLWLYVSEDDPSYYDAVIYDRLQPSVNGQFKFSSRFVLPNSYGEENLPW